MGRPLGCPNSANQRRRPAVAMHVGLRLPRSRNPCHGRTPLGTPGGALVNRAKRGGLREQGGEYPDFDLGRAARRRHQRAVCRRRCRGGASPTAKRYNPPRLYASGIRLFGIRRSPILKSVPNVKRCTFVSCRAPLNVDNDARRWLDGSRAFARHCSHTEVGTCASALHMLLPTHMCAFS